MNSPTKTISKTNLRERKGAQRRPRTEPLVPSSVASVEETSALFFEYFKLAVTASAVTLPDGRFVKVNPAFCTMLGYTEAELLDLHPECLLEPDQWCRLVEISLDILDGKRNLSRIFLECKHKSGKTILGLLTLSLISDKAGNPSYFMAQVQDVGNLIRTETKLQENRLRFRALSEATFEAVFISKKGICIEVNQIASTMFGAPREELIGIFGTDVISSEYQSIVREKMLSGDETPYRAVAIKKDGTHFHVMIQGKMIRIGGSKVRLTVVRDIDAQVTAEAALRESERHLRSLMESASNFVLFRLCHRPDTPYRPRRIFISPSIAEIVDLTQVFDFESWLEMLRSDDRDLLLAAGLKMLDTHRLDETVRIRDRSGKGWRWLHIISVAVPDGTDNRLYFNGIILDITKEVEATAALKSREKDLNERTTSLSEANTALEVLLRKREADRMEMEEKILTNAKSLILPYLEKLNASRLDERQQVYLKLVESNLNEIISPLSSRMSRHYLNLTPMEIQVANLVKAGKKTKEIAQVIGVSVRTIEAVRYTIRRKLGIKKKRSNLRAYLISIDATLNGDGDDWSR